MIQAPATKFCWLGLILVWSNQALYQHLIVESHKANLMLELLLSPTPMTPRLNPKFCQSLDKLQSGRVVAYCTMPSSVYWILFFSYPFFFSAKSGSASSPENVNGQKQWLDEEIERAIEQQNLLKQLEEALRAREAAVIRREEVLQQKEALETKKIRSSQVRLLWIQNWCKHGVIWRCVHLCTPLTIAIRLKRTHNLKFNWWCNNQEAGHKILILCSKFYGVNPNTICLAPVAALLLLQSECVIGYTGTIWLHIWLLWLGFYTFL